MVLRPLLRGEEEGEHADERSAERVRHPHRTIHPLEVGVEVVLDVDLPDRGADGRDLQPALGEDSPGLVQLLVGQLEHVHVPGTAKLEEADTQLLEHIALDVQIRIDLVGEPGQRPHRRSPVRRSAKGDPLVDVAYWSIRGAVWVGRQLGH
jgi:hypothetical protein